MAAIQVEEDDDLILVELMPTVALREALNFYCIILRNLLYW
jgi:hypothetical protein